VRLDPGRIDYAQTSDQGADLRFVESDGTLLPYEIESWNPGGISIIWVRVPQIDGSSDSDSIWLYYGNPAAADGQDPEGVWDATFAGVWHFNGDFLDATANLNDGTNFGTTGVAGQFAGARSFDGVDDYIDAGSDPSLGITGQMTLEAWIKIADQDQFSAPRMLSKKDNWNDPFGYNLEYKPGDNNLTSVGSGPDFGRADGIDLDTNWHHVAAVIDGATAAMYIDGVDLTTDGAISPLAANSQPLNFGRRSGGGDYYWGALDEVRISNTARSPDWMAAQYLSMTDSFIIFGGGGDAAGLSDTATVAIYPQTTFLTLESNPPGLALGIYAELDPAPYSIEGIVGAATAVSAPSPQFLGNVEYVFSSWSDGGAQNHNITIPGSPQTLVANFQAVTNQSPTVAITSPVPFQNFSQTGSITIAADASDPDGSVAQVEFYVDGQLVGTDFTSPFTTVWNASIPGAYVLTAVATDLENASTTSSNVAVTIAIDPNLDSDGDNIPNVWEMQYDLDETDPNDAADDPDGDGLTNQAEFTYQTDPTLADTDGDNFDDGLEVSYNTDPNNPNDFPTPAITIDSPSDEAVITGDQIVISYTLSGYLATGDHIHWTLDSPPYIAETDRDGTFIFDNVSPGPHTILAQVVSQSHVPYGNPDAEATIDVTLESGIAWTNVDIGSPGQAGSAIESAGVFTIEGGGADIWGVSDAFHFVYWPLTGDGEATARVLSVENTDVWAKAGVMIRESLDAASPHAMTILAAANGVAFQRRITTGGASIHMDAGSGAGGVWLRIVRSGNTITGYRSADGVNWSQIGSPETIAMANDVYIGLAVTAHNDGTLCTAEFDNVQISGQTPTDTVPPNPDPMTWSTAPSATGSSAIAMTASTATDPSGVEYYFDCLSAGCTASGWQDSPAYEDTNLTPDTTYSYRVRTRDKSASPNAAGWSTAEAATTSAVAVNAFQQSSGAAGILSIEVENHDSNTSQGSHSWVLVSSPTGASNDLAMESQPDSGTNQDTGYVDNSPRLDFQVYFVKTGIHYAWARLYADGGLDNSLHVGLDGNANSTADRITGPSGSWTWTNDTMDSARATLDVASTGLRTLNIWMREDGSTVDQIVLTTDAGYTPGGTGPAESPRGEDTTAPQPDPLTWADMPYAAGATSIAMTAATATDPSGVEYYFDCISAGCADSGWQDSAAYEDTGLTPDTTYTYQVRARDKSVNQNETDWSSQYSSDTLPESTAIEFDNSASAYNAGDGNALSWTHTIGNGSNRILIVGVAAEDNVAANLVVGSVTFNGTLMQPVSGTESTAGSSYLQKTGLYYLLEADLPPAGSYTVTVTYNGAVDDRSGGSISLSNAAQQAAEAAAANGNTSSNTIASTVTVVSEGAWVVDVVGCGNAGSFVPTGGGMTERFDVSPDSSSAAGSTRALSSIGPVTMSWQHSGANRLAHSVAVLAPF